MTQRKLFKLASVLFLIVVCQLVSYAQGNTGSISGSVVDATGAVVPNAVVVVKGQGGQKFTVNTTDNGTYQIPAVANGLYTVTVTLSGFKTSVTNNVKVDVGTPATVDVKLETGDVGATVIVTSGAEVLQTATPAVSTTLTNRQITETPQPNRDALDLITLLPGTAQVGRPRASSINGLPKSSLAITIDGVDVNDNLNKSSDGFFTFVRPRLDSIEEVNVSTAASGSDSGGDGAVQIKFVTKRGTNSYNGGLFWQHRDEGLNSNYWWNNVNNLQRGIIRLNQFGGNFGGYIPVLPRFGEGGPGWMSGKDKAFFFTSYEEFRIPESAPRTRGLLTADAANGIFRYGNGGQVNLLNLAGARGFTNTLDPTISALNAAIRSSTSNGTLTSSGNPNTQALNFTAKNQQKRTFFALRFDVNLTKRISVENVYNRQIFANPGTALNPGADLLNNADPSFPGFTNFGSQSSNRYSNSTAVRWTITNNIVNEARLAHLFGSSFFFNEVNQAQFANQKGYNLNFNGSYTGAEIFPAFLGLTNVTAGTPDAGVGLSTTGNSTNPRSSPTWDFTDNLTWIKGNHTMSYGGQYKKVQMLFGAFNEVVPSVYFGLGTDDPVETSDVFNTSTLPGASVTDIINAKALYSLLTGRVTNITGSAYLTSDGTYKYLGFQETDAHQVTYGLYGQDSWRIKPNLTLNYGLRWQPDLGFVTDTSNFSAASSFADAYGISGLGNLFKPGTLTGKVPTFKVVPGGYHAYNADYKNFAPSVGVVYSPDMGDKGILRSLLGESGKSVFRAGYSRSFVREGTAVGLTVLTSNPGSSVDDQVDVSLGNLASGTLFRNIGSVAIPGFPATPPSTITGTETDAVWAFDPNIKTGYVNSWSIGYQRELDKNTVIEARYVGNRGRDLWRLYTINEINLTQNRFVDEYRLALANLAANNAAGGTRAGSFAYFGSGTGTSPLPIIQSYFRGAGDPNNQAQYTSANYKSTTFTNQLNPLVPNAITFASNLDNSVGRRANAAAAGLPANFFFVNPTTRGGSNIVDNSSTSQYDSFQVELRRRLSYGLQVNANYTFAKSLANSFAASGAAARNFRSLQNRSLDDSISPFDVTHAFKVNWIYELPFGRGQLFFSNANRVSNFFFGGWTINGALKVQSGTPINFGNVNLVGMTRKDLEKAVGNVYHNQSVSYNGASRVTLAAAYLPTDIIENTSLAFNNKTFSGRAITPAAYGGCVQAYVGQCGFSELIVHGPNFTRLDLTLRKSFQFSEKRNIQIATAFYNALNQAQWRVGGWTADAVAVAGLNGTGFGRYTTGTVYQDTSTTNDQGGRTVELILRINF